jgi:hypothetical protein
MYQASSSRYERAEAIAHRPQQPLGDRQLAAIADAAAQAGDDRRGARPVAAGNHRRQRDEGLAQQECRAVGLGRVVETHRGTRCSGTRCSDRGARRECVVDDGKAPAGDFAPDDPAQGRHKAEQPEPAALDHPVVSLPAEPRHQGQERLRDRAAAGQQGSDDQFRHGGPRSFRNGQHDLPEPIGKRRREAGFRVRFHVACGRLVHTRDMGSVLPATPLETVSRLPTGPD